MEREGLTESSSDLDECHERELTSTRSLDGGLEGERPVPGQADSQLAFHACFRLSCRKDGHDTSDFARLENVERLYLEKRRVRSQSPRGNERRSQTVHGNKLTFLEVVDMR